MKSILKVLFLLLTTVLLPSAGLAQSLDYTRWVNPFIGTGGHGHTFPGATMPFGMVQLSPDTRIDNWDGSSGYHYSDDTIYGFSHTHLSGTGIPDGCDILFMPLKGKNSNSGVAPRIGATNFSHSNERAEPGYYSVKLDNGILAEMTASSRVGVHRYTFPENEEANLWLDLKWRDTIIGSQITFVNSTRIEGFRRSRSWAKDQTVYFVAEFSKPFKYWAVYEGGNSVRTDEGYPFDSKEEVKAMINGFPRNSRQLTLKVAISYVSIEGARKNLAAELPGWDFDKVRADAKAAWNKELSKIEVSGGTDAQTTTFYTALYHTMIQPNVFNDVDGSYLGLDKRIHNIGSDGKERTTPSAQSGGHPSFVRRGAGKNPKSKIQNREINTRSFRSGTRSGRPIRFIRSSIRNGRWILSTRSFANTSRAGGCRFGNCGARRPTR